ncbi:MAG: hypothetical protein GEU90_19610, partial [Gemmatimonas sp.]|nr:hypothetical protein [Gemmatimonas sp.]
MREKPLVVPSSGERRRTARWVAALITMFGGLGSIGVLFPQDGAAAGRGGSAALAVADTGFVIESEAVIENCGACHV